MNTKVGPVLEVTTCSLQGKFGVEIRIKSVNKDHSHSWVRISRGMNKLVTDLSNNNENDNNEQETSEMQFQDFALKANVLAFASRSKAKPNHKDFLLPAHLQELYPSGKESELILSQKINRPSLAQCQTTDYSPSSWSSTSRRWSD